MKTLYDYLIAMYIGCDVNICCCELTRCEMHRLAEEYIIRGEM